jgi:hypothetical protein
MLTFCSLEKWHLTFSVDPQFAMLRASDAGAKLKLLEVQKLEEEAKRVRIKKFLNLDLTPFFSD